MSRYHSGKLAEAKGRHTEALFKTTIEMNGGLAFRIENGGRKNKAGIFFRQYQICDFIVFINGTLYLLDVKSTSKKITPSFFKPETTTPYRKLSSTQRQYFNFMKLFDMGFKDTGFVFIEKDNQTFKILKTEHIFNGDLEPKPLIL